MGTNNETDKLDVTSIVRGEVFQWLDPYIRVWRDNEYYYLQLVPDEKPMQYLSLNKLFKHPIIDPVKMMGRRQLRLWKANQRDTKKPQVIKAITTPHSGYRLPPRCRVITVQVDFDRHVVLGRKPKKSPKSRFFTYELLDGNVDGDPQANLIVAYTDGHISYVDVYQHGHILFSIAHEFEAAAIVQFDKLQKEMSFELMNVRRFKEPHQELKGYIQYNPVRWATGKFKRLLEKPKDMQLPQRKDGSGYVRPPMNDAEWLKSRGHL